MDGNHGIRLLSIGSQSSVFCNIVILMQQNDFALSIASEWQFGFESYSQIHQLL